MGDFLWITPKWPLPANDGARQATSQLLAGLCAQGSIIDLVAMVPEDEAVRPEEASEILGVRTATVVRRPTPSLGHHLRNLCLHPRRPLTLAQYAVTAMSEQLAERTLGSDTAVVFDGLHAASWLHEVDEWHHTNFIYRAHNVESDLWFRTASQKSQLMAPFFVWQGNAVRAFESRLCRTARRVLAVSDDDADRFREITPAANVATLPIGMEPKPQRERPTDGTQLLFIGRLDWPPNRDGLKWFLNRVWPNVTRGFTLNIVGSGDASWLSSYLHDSRLRFHGMVESVTQYYHDAILNVVPVFYGSGTRVKAIESSLFATACLSTAKGVEGLGLEPGQDYLQAESEAQWVECLNGLDPDLARRIGQKALEHAAARFDRDRTAERFLHVTRAESLRASP